MAELRVIKIHHLKILNIVIKSGYGINAIWIADVVLHEFCAVSGVKHSCLYNKNR